MTFFHGCYSIGEDTLWGINHRHKGGAQSLDALESIRAHAPDGQPFYVVLDNISAHGTPKIRRCANHHTVQLCSTPTYASWANPIEMKFGVLRQLTMTNSSHRTMSCRPGGLYEYPLAHAHSRDPKILEAPRTRRVRSEKGHRWDRPDKATRATLPTNQVTALGAE